jgi:hypothetical protein
VGRPRHRGLLRGFGHGEVGPPPQEPAAVRKHRRTSLKCGESRNLTCRARALVSAPVCAAACSVGSGTSSSRHSSPDSRAGGPPSRATPAS